MRVLSFSAGSSDSFSSPFGMFRSIILRVGNKGAGGSKLAAETKRVAGGEWQSPEYPSSLAARGCKFISNIRAGGWYFFVCVFLFFSWQ